MEEFTQGPLLEEIKPIRVSPIIEGLEKSMQQLMVLETEAMLLWEENSQLEVA